MEVAIWRPASWDDVTTLNTMGMSEKSMPGADYIVELNLACRRKLSETDEQRLATLLANITQYPFAHNRKLDWWERLANPNGIPVFDNCTQILFAPSFADSDLSWLETPKQPVKLLHVIPITERENHILAAHGVEAFKTYLDEEGVDLFSPPNERRASRPVGENNET